MSIVRHLENRSEAGRRPSGQRYSDIVQYRVVPRHGLAGQQAIAKYRPWRQAIEWNGSVVKDAYPDIEVTFDPTLTDEQMAWFILTDPEFREQVRKAHEWGVAHPWGYKQREESSHYRELQTQNLKEATREIDELVEGTVRDLPAIGEALVLLKRTNDGSLRKYLEEFKAVVGVPGAIVRYAGSHPRESVYLGGALVAGIIAGNLKPSQVDDVVNSTGGRKVASEASEVGASSGDRNWIFRGDSNYKDGAVGRALGAEADAADIQNFADHVLRKESRLSSRYTSFTTETKVARKFPPASDNRYVNRALMERLRELEARGQIKIWMPDEVYESLRTGPNKLRKQAADVRAAMQKNSEILIEGQIPAGILQGTN